jgi:hypothetical protein
MYNVPPSGPRSQEPWGPITGYAISADDNYILLTGGFNASGASLSLCWVTTNGAVGAWIISMYYSNQTAQPLPVYPRM